MEDGSRLWGVKVSDYSTDLGNSMIRSMEVFRHSTIVVYSSHSTIVEDSKKASCYRTVVGCNMNRSMMADHNMNWNTVV